MTIDQNQTIPIEQIINVIAHDLKSTLKISSNVSGLLKKSAQDRLNEKELQYVDFISSSIDGLSMLLNELQQYYRSVALPLQKEELSLSDLLVEASNELSINREEAEGNLDTSQVTGSIYADHTYMIQVMIRLLDSYFSASTFAPDSKMIITNLEESHNSVVLFSVNDPSMAQELEYDIHTPYDKVDDIKSYLGTGLELGVCSKILSWHGGTLAYSTVPEVGCIYTLVIPKASLV